MVLKSDLVNLLPDRGNRVVLVNDQTTADIEKNMITFHKSFFMDYDYISELFLGNTVLETAENIWNFLRFNVPYKMEPGKTQTVRAPAAILKGTADCKSYALFSAGIIQSLNFFEYFNIPYALRFASYSKNENKTPTHVFTVLYPGTDQEIWIDPVPEVKYFNDQTLIPNFYKDEIFTNMALVGISGITEMVNTTIKENNNDIEILTSLKNGLNVERLERLSNGSLIEGSISDLEYIEAIMLVDAQIKNNGIGNIDPAKIGIVVSEVVDIAKLILPLFGKKSKEPGDIAAQSDGWNISDRELGHNFGWAAADVILNGRPDIEYEQLLRWLDFNGTSQLKQNNEWGRRVTDQDIINYFVSKGAPLSDDQKRSYNLPTGGITSFLNTSDQPGASGTNKYILPIVLLGGAALLYFVTKK